jgi:hypothetical protein
MLTILRFLIYYLHKRTSVFFGFHRTINPLSIRWRWDYWVRKLKNKRAFTKPASSIPISAANPTKSK